jgi:hypothetical protein
MSRPAKSDIRAQPDEGSSPNSPIGQKCWDRANPFFHMFLIHKNDQGNYRRDKQQHFPARNTLHADWFI